jgi:hypothetical protein
MINVFFIFLSGIILLTNPCLGYEKSDAFNVKVFNSRIKVLAPEKYHPKLSVIIENKSLSTLIGQVVKGDSTVIKIIRVKPGSFESVDLGTQKNERVFFIPISPPSQRVELIIGKHSYEIPPKR